MLCDGTVVPCCLDSEGRLALGNLHRQELAEILASPRATAMAAGFSAAAVGGAVPPLRLRCTVQPIRGIGRMIGAIWKNRS